MVIRGNTGTRREVFGRDSDLYDAIRSLKKRPDSKARCAAIQEEVQFAEADENAEIIEAAGQLLEQLGPDRLQASGISAETIQGLVRAGVIGMRESVGLSVCLGFYKLKNPISPLLNSLISL